MYLEQYRHDIAVSYAASDNQPFRAATRGWVDGLLEDLYWYLGQKLGEQPQFWSPQAIAGQQVIADERLARLRDAATVIVLLSKAYLQTPQYQAELAAILSHIPISSNRLFVVELTQLTRPEPLDAIRGYRLWTTDSRQQARTLGSPSFQSERDEVDYKNQLEDLARDLSGVLEDLRAPPPPMPSPVIEVSPAESRPQVLLAAVTDDLYWRRKEVKHYLEYNEIAVLPVEPYRVAEAVASWQGMFTADLAQAVAFVQLLSDSAQLAGGVSLPQWQFSTVQRERPTLPILQWRASSVDLANVQDAALSALLTGTEVRVTDLERFKAEVVRQVQALVTPAYGRVKPADCQAVFINACVDDVGLAERLSECACEDYAWLCSLPLTLEEIPPDPLVAWADLEAHLTHCDALLLLYGHSPKAWIRQQLVHMVKVIASRESRPFVALCEVDPLPKPDLRVRIPAFIQVLDCGALSEAAILQRFVQAMEATG